MGFHLRSPQKQVRCAVRKQGSLRALGSTVPVQESCASLTVARFVRFYQDKAGPLSYSWFMGTGIYVKVYSLLK